MQYKILEMVLVEKYQRSVHALAWRQTGDFHDAEEITQDTFLRAYQKLSTLRDPSKFLGWLCVIANRRKQKPEKQWQSLEATPMEEITETAYAHYVIAKLTGFSHFINAATAL